MEWLGLALWVLALLIALPLSARAGLTSPLLGMQGPMALAGLAAVVLYVALDGGRWLAWISGGFALAAFAALGAGATALLSDAPRSASAGQAAEEQAATLAGIQGPLLATVGFSMILAAAGTTTVG